MTLKTCKISKITWKKCCTAPKKVSFKELRRKVDCNFRGNLLKNHFMHLKFYLNPPNWLARSCCHMSIFWKTKGWSSHFWEGQTFRFFYVGVHCQRKLKSPERIFLLNLRLWPTQKPKILSIFYGKKFIWENSVV